ncbi:MAG: HAD family phosphatase, partial [Merismopedia sp. SIO2A8]|nr:HAD family phosphatase [Merismopedia sp. SIO2A8]
DRACLNDLLTRRGRTPTDAYLNSLVERKSQAYQKAIATINPLPIYPGVEDIIFRLRSLQIPLAIVSGAVRTEIQIVLERAGLASHFPIIVAGDDIPTSKPDPTGLLVAVQKLQQKNPTLNLIPANCLVIEDSPAGITAAKNAGMSVVGVANTYPYHMIQRQANWAIDYLTELELDRIRSFFERHNEKMPSA